MLGRPLHLQKLFGGISGTVPYLNIHFCVTELSAFDAGKLLLDGAIDTAFTPKRSDKCAFELLKPCQNPVTLGVAEWDFQVGSKAGIGDILDLPLGYFNALMPLEHVTYWVIWSWAPTPSPALVVFLDYMKRQNI